MTSEGLMYLKREGSTRCVWTGWTKAVQVTEWHRVAGLNLKAKATKVSLLTLTCTVKHAHTIPIPKTAVLNPNSELMLTHRARACTSSVTATRRRACADGDG